MTFGDTMATSSRHLFVIDPLKNLNLAWDTTVKLAFTMTRLGVDVFAVEPSGLTLESHPTRVFARARPMVFQDKPNSVALGNEETFALSSFDAVHMRKEPPYDLSYVEALWILQYAKAQTKIWNDPLALQQINEKLVIAEFTRDARPYAVSSDPETLAAFAERVCGGNIVVKPLNLYGGRGVVHLQDPKTLRDDLTRETQSGTLSRLVQKFEPKVTDGEVRAFAVAGKPVSWCLKIPHKGDFLANTRAGSTLRAYTPTPAEVETVTRVATELAGRGVMVAGFDLIAGSLSEVNITCPALLSPVRDSLAGFEEIAKILIHSA